MSPADYLTTLTWRYACKKFDPTAKIAPDVMQALEESLRLAPSSIGLQPWHFVMVHDQSVKKSLRAISKDQAQVEDCSCYAVLCALRQPSVDDVECCIARIAEVRQPSPEKLAGSRAFYTQVIESLGDQVGVWAEHQVYLALGFLLSAAALLRVDSCTIGSMDGPKCDMLLGLDKGPYRAVLGVALGYRSANDAYALEAKVRFPREAVIEER